MPANLASTAVLNGDVDYNGAVTGTIGAAVQGRPMKVLLFTVAKPLLFLMGQKNIKDVKQLKGKKDRRQLSRRLSDFAGQSSAKTNRPRARQRRFGSANVRQRRQPLRGAGIRRRRCVLALRARNIIAHEKGYNELLFLGDVVEFPRTASAHRISASAKHPDEVYRMVRATLRGLQFIWDKK